MTVDCSKNNIRITDKPEITSDTINITKSIIRNAYIVVDGRYNDTDQGRYKETEKERLDVLQEEKP